jgi:putative hydrolase of the HAD superfamily
MYKAIIFDFFDVIRTDSFKHWLNKHGYKLEGDFKRVNQSMDRGEIDVEEFIAELGKIVGRSAEDILAEMEADTNIDYVVLAIAEQLHDNYRIGLLSNAASSFLRDVLKEHGLTKYFDEIVFSSEVGMIKPNPEMFHHILEKMHVTPAETIFIDDNPNNIAGAEAIGITGIVFTTAAALKTSLDELGIKLEA